MDELRYLAEVLGGRILLSGTHNAENPVISYGDDGGPMLFHVKFSPCMGADGIMADHWVLLETYMSRGSLIVYTSDTALGRRALARTPGDFAEPDESGDDLEPEVEESEEADCEGGESEEAEEDSEKDYL
eukprot:2579963-Pyramimonas_sp.AAC.1